MPLQWNTVFDKISEGVLAFDRSGVFVYANESAATLFGKKPAELIGRSIRALVSKGDAGNLPEIMVHSLEENRPAEIEEFSEATRRWHAVRVYPGESGATVFLQDITDKKLAEDSLRVSEAKFAGIVNISADAIISVDIDQHIIHFNSGAEEIFGWTAAEIIGQKLDDLIPERFRAAHPQHMRDFGA